MNEQLVSVILPTYNRIKTIQRAIDSVLNQTYQNIELIIVDDNSTDGTFELISELYGDDERIIYIMNDNNMGPAKARNLGVQAAHGDIIAFQDSDDAWRPDKLDKQMAMLKNAGDEVGMIYSQYILHQYGGREAIFPAENIPMESKSGDIFSYLLISPLCGTPTMLIRKQYFINVGGFSTNIHSLEDYEFSIRFAQKYHILLCNESLVDAYETENSIGKQHREAFRVECLIMNMYRTELEKYGLKTEKMTSVWTKSMNRGVVDVIEDNIKMFITDKDYCQAFAILESKRLATIFNESEYHVGIFLNDENITFGNGTRPERGNPGMDERQYELLLLIHYLAMRENNTAVTVYHLNHKNILPYDVKSVIVNDKYEAVKKCNEDRQDCMIFLFEKDKEWYNVIDKYAVPSICLKTALPVSEDAEFTEILLQNNNIKRVIDTDKTHMKDIAAMHENLFNECKCR